MTSAPRSRTRVLVLLSGGVDSTVALYASLAAGDQVEALMVRHPAQPRGERLAARGIAADAGVPLREIDAPWLQARPGARPEGYIPHRNAVFFSVAAHVADAQGFDAVVGGQNREDAEGFPDAAAGFLSRLAALLGDGAPGGRRVAIRVPLISLSKREVVALGRRLGAPVDRTWSCYRAAGEPCGACTACVERASSLVVAG